MTNQPCGEGNERFADSIGIGMPPENRRQMLIKMAWMLLWMLYLVYPVEDLISGHHSVTARVLGWLALAAFLSAYISLVLFRGMIGRDWGRATIVSIVLMPVLSLATVIGLGGPWITLFIYTSVTMGAVLPPRYSLRGVLGTTLLTLGVGLTTTGVSDGSLYPLVFTAFLAGMAMAGLQRLVRTMRELREARETVAHLAAADERLRLARDLHDLLGQSLSLVILKSELTGRFLDQDRSADARAQVADIERVSRQALVDVREAVGGYRLPKLVVELAAARTALAAAKISIDADPALGELPAGLGPEEEGALGWALRESVTNIVRHSNADLCTLRLSEPLEEDGARSLSLEITDNGRGPGRGSAPGNGLTGLTERLALVGGGLETGSGPGNRGFRLRATVPLRPARAPEPDGAGTVRSAFPPA